MLKFCRVYFYTSNSSLLPPNCFLFSLYQKPITYHVAFSILPLAKLVEGVSGFFYNIYKERRKGRRIKGSSEKEEDGMAQKGETLVEVKDLCKTSA